MWETMKQKTLNFGLTNKEVTPYGLSSVGLVVVHGKESQEHMIKRGYPLHSVFGKKFFFCFLGSCY